MTIYLTLISALVVTHAMLRRLISLRCIIIIIIIINIITKYEIEFVSYRRSSRAGGSERAAGAKNPRAASAGCYIDRCTCGSTLLASRLC